MRYAMIGTDEARDWRVVLHMPLTWKGEPRYTPQLHHLDRYTRDRAQLAFPGRKLVLRGVYYSKRNPD